MDDKSLEKVFIESWDSVLLSYHAPILLAGRREYIVMDTLIHNLRLRGLDKKLRAGKSMERLMLSRSLEYGLRDHQPFIGFHPNSDKTIEVFQFYLDETERFTLQSPEITPDVERLLQMLLAHPID